MKKSILFFIILTLISAVSNSNSQLIWSTYIGGNNRDDAYGGLKVDSIGNSFITGETFSSNFPISTGAYQTSQKGSDDVFVTKLNYSGSNIIFSTFIGGPGRDLGEDIAIDKFGNSYISGYCENDYPVTPGAFCTKYSDSMSFISKINSTGTTLVYSTIIGSICYNAKLALNLSMNSYILGNLARLDSFPITSGAYDQSYNGSFDITLTKLNSIGNDIIYSTFIGGSGGDWGGDIVIDSIGNTLITGYTTSTDFPITADVFQKDFKGIDSNSSNAFLLKLNDAGSLLTYSTYIGGKHKEEASSIAIDNQENPIIAGETASDNFPIISGSYSTNFNGYEELFITKFDSNASSLIFSTFLGGSIGNVVFSLVLGHDFNIYFTGMTMSDDFPVTNNAFDKIYNNKLTICDCFITEMNSEGNKLFYSSYLGSENYNYGYGIALDNVNNVFLTGLAGSSNFPVTSGAFDTKYNGNFDAFVTKLCPGNGQIKSVSSINFLVKECSSFSLDTFYIKNTSTCDLLLNKYQITGLYSSNFSVLKPDKFPMTIFSDDSLAIIVKYSTVDSNRKTGKLIIYNNSPDSVWQINLIGNADLINISVNNSESDTIVIDLGTICPGSNKDTTITIINKSIIGSSINISNPAPPFQITGTDKAESGKVDKPEAVEKKKK